MARKNDGIEYEGVPNMDEMSHDELMNFWSKYHRPSRRLAEKLIGGWRPNYIKITQAIANYAVNRAVVITCENQGDANGVRVYEHACKLCFDKIPKDLRWR